MFNKLTPAISFILSAMTPLSPEINKELVLNLQTPQVFKNIPLRWKCFSQDLVEWIGCWSKSDEHKDGILFDCASMYNGQSPQWECKRDTVRLTGKSFLDTFGDGKKNEQWVSFSYKDLKDLPLECREGVSLSAMGFEDLNEFSFWLGSAGAHTPCHFDTYGCNLVVQVFGRKSWLLFPPSAKLTSTRVPYEESSVYCKENFFSPCDGFGDFKSIDTDAYHVVLEPGDVLLVPPKWWHYVESIDVSLAINTWIPLDSDLDAQIDECLIKINITEHTRDLSESLKQSLINPNEFNSLHSTFLVENLKLLKQLKSLTLNKQLREEILSTYPSNYLDEMQIAQLLTNQSEYMIAVPRLSRKDFRSFIEKNFWRFRKSNDRWTETESSDEFEIISEFINGMCSKIVVDNVNDSLFNKLTTKYSFTLYALSI